MKYLRKNLSVSLPKARFWFPIKNVDLPLAKKALILISIVGLLELWLRTHQLFLKGILILTVLIMNNTLIKIFNTLDINFSSFKLRIFRLCRFIKITYKNVVFMSLLRKSTLRFPFKFRLLLYVFVGHSTVVDSF